MTRSPLSLRDGGLEIAARNTQTAPKGIGTGFQAESLTSEMESRIRNSSKAERLNLGMNMQH
jgi:hypothetical protein